MSHIFLQSGDVVLVSNAARQAGTYYNVRAERVDTPPKYLVGIEPNPGPKHGLLPFGDLIKTGSKAAAAFTGAVAGAKVAKDIVKSVVGSKPSKPKSKPRDRNYGRNGVRVSNKSLSRLTTAPLQQGFVSSMSTGNLDAGISIPFEGSCIELSNTTGSTQNSWAPTFGDGSNFSTVGLDISPFTFATHATPFPIPIVDIAKCFTLFRMKKLKVRYQSLYPSTVAGVVALGCTADPFDAAPTSIRQVGSASVNMLTSAWQTCELDLTPVVSYRNAAQPWFQVNCGANTQAQTRQTAAGSIQMYCAGFPNTVTGAVIGYLFFSGEIEFRGLTTASLDGANSQESKIPEEKDEEFDTLPDNPPLLIRQESHIPTLSTSLGLPRNNNVLGIPR